MGFSVLKIKVVEWHGPKERAVGKIWPGRLPRGSFSARMCYRESKRHGAARAAQKPCAVTGFGSASIKSQRTAKVALRFEKVNISSCLTVEEDRGKTRLVQL